MFYYFQIYILLVLLIMSVAAIVAGNVSIIFKWYDGWLGFFYDTKKKWLYFLPFPFFGFVFKFKTRALTAEDLFPKDFNIKLSAAIEKAHFEMREAMWRLSIKEQMNDLKKDIAALKDKQDMSEFVKRKNKKRK